MMIRFLGLYIFMLSLLPNFEGHEFLKLPILLVHFYEHASETESTSWSRFIEEHYGQTAHSESDHQHEDLPFKDHSCQMIQLVSIPHEFPEFSFFNIQPKPELNAHVPVMHSRFMLNFWQPPKLG